MAFEVVIIECERGWGSKVDEVRCFETEEAREQFIAEFNAVNDKDEVPDWYMYARKA